MTVPTFFFIYKRLASAIGNGGLADVGHPIVDGDVIIEMPLSEQTQKSPDCSGLFFFVASEGSLLEFLDLGLLAAQSAQVVNA